MNDARHISQHQFIAAQAARTSQRIDLTPEEREQIETACKPADEFHTIASFWVLAILLLVIVAVAPALEAATHHLT